MILKSRRIKFGVEWQSCSANLIVIDTVCESSREISIADHIEAARRDYPKHVAESAAITCDDVALEIPRAGILRRDSYDAATFVTCDRAICDVYINSRQLDSWSTRVVADRGIDNVQESVVGRCCIVAKYSTARVATDSAIDDSCR